MCNECRNWERIHNTLFSFELKNEPNKLECFVTLSWKGLPLTKNSSLLAPFVSYKENEVLQLYSQNFNFFVT
jgi:hypothetical protein